MMVWSIKNIRREVKMKIGFLEGNIREKRL